jgi:monothiol glutaredoxin
MKFKVVSSQSQVSSEQNTRNPQGRIEAMVSNSPVFLFMKGTPEIPQCGFSAKMTQILRSWEIPFQSFDVLSDHDIREGIKTYSNWPTIPQLYINKSFVGGSDIVTELSDTREWLPLLKEAYPDREFTPPPAPAEVKEASPQQIAEQLKNDANCRFIDVRSPEEWELARVEGAELIDQELVDEMLSSWDRNTPIILICHHGMRSLDAARFLTSQGFQDVSHVEGGINNWSQSFDPAIPLY